MHPIVTASFDAWIKFYRQDENSPNTSISYYIKGSVVAFLLDARIRRVSSDKRSLDDVMRAAYAKHQANVDIRSRSFERSSKMSPERASNRSGHRHSKAPPNSITPTRSMRSGLRFKIAEPDDGKTPRKATLGAITKIDGGRIVVSQVRRGTPSHEAGLNVDDEILAIDDFQSSTRSARCANGAVSRRRSRVDPCCATRSIDSSRRLSELSPQVMAARGRPIGHSGRTGRAGLLVGLEWKSVRTG